MKILTEKVERKKLFIAFALESASENIKFSWASILGMARLVLSLFKCLNKVFGLDEKDVTIERSCFIFASAHFACVPSRALFV